MADNIYDLRKYNIKDMKDAMEFLELVEARIPQIVKVVRKQRLVEASLNNRLSIAQNRPQPATVIEETDMSKNTSVLTQLTNQNTTHIKPDASRLAQMKAAQAPTVDETKKEQIKAAAAQVRVGQLPAPVQPGTIGELNIPDGLNDNSLVTSDVGQSPEPQTVEEPQLESYPVVPGAVPENTPEGDKPSAPLLPPTETDPNKPSPVKPKGITRKK